MLSATVIVPTYRRPDDLVRCLDALAAQDTADFEVVVVDNDAAGDVERQVAAFGPGSATEVRYVAEPALGVHNARHAGARAARAPLLLFTDDDVVCCPGWVRAYRDAFAQLPEVAAAGGPVLPRWEEEPPPWLRELVESSVAFAPLALMEPHDQLVVPPRGFFYSSNMAIRRDVLFELGGFDPEAFGPIWLGDGETGLNVRLWERERPVAYVPEARALHSIPANRMTMGYLSRRMHNQGAADVYTELHGRQISRRGLFRMLMSALWRRGRIGLASLRRRRRLDSTSIWVHLTAARRAGSVAYLWRLLGDRALWPLVERERWLEPGR